MEGEDAKVKVGGLWSGTIQVDLDKWTVSMLRDELGKKSNCSPDSLNVICAGRILKHELADTILRNVGFKCNSKILISKVAADQGKAINDELTTQTRLARIKAAVDAMTKRHTNDSFPVDQFSIELENQHGEKMSAVSETDQRAVMMGLMLHAKGRHFIEKGQYKEALEILSMGEEAFTLCNQKVLEMVDNVPLLQIDTVWCYFMLRDISCLSMAGRRLKEARKGLERCYGANMERARVLQGGFCPELAIFTRLELLEGIVAYHTELFKESHKALKSAQEKYNKLQVSDEALAQLVSMGYTEQQSRRALRMSDQNVQRAVEFAIEEKEKINKRIQEDRLRNKEIREQKSYGRTLMGKAVDMTILSRLASLGYEKALASEALRKNENDMQKALDDLTDPESNSVLQHSVDSRRRKRRKSFKEEDIAEILSMGFERSRVVKALSNSGTKEHAIDFLLRELPNQAGGSSGGSASEGSSVAKEDSQPDDTPGSQDQMQDDMGHPINGTSLEERDEEMEEEIAKSLTGDPLADYDIEVEEEGRAIVEYLTLLASSGHGQ
ncbi:hypothetical protein SUGI_0742380 [Cryptomeria japonica]|uniref:uncharacterized protein LOC131065740 n=1 Tax=Cryptomeria japonica TaxID=3369 RepID=UPI002414A994|nr:uncharacterized protein LOC131065740 [Cryptomeria japonica]GLJ36803.1 hypothetical protein SUGI_0742380 [Cryptomeria japonica]